MDAPMAAAALADWHVPRPNRRHRQLAAPRPRRRPADGARLADADRRSFAAEDGFADGGAAAVAADGGRAAGAAQQADAAARPVRRPERHARHFGDAPGAALRL
eukprot:6827625-Prymnesium_polylepis.1